MHPVAYNAWQIKGSSTRQWKYFLEKLCYTQGRILTIPNIHTVEKVGFILPFWGNKNQ